MAMTESEAWGILRKPFEIRKTEIGIAIIEGMGTHLDAEGEDVKSDPVERQLGIASALAEAYVVACCEAWNKTGRPRSGAFYRVIFKECLDHLFADRSHAIHRRVKRERFLSQDGPAADEMKERHAAMERQYAIDLAILKRRWERELEKWALASEDREKSGRVVQDGIPGCPSLRGGSISLPPDRQTDAGEVKPQKPAGRPGVDKKFRYVGGELYNAIRGSRPRRLSKEEWKTFARRLDGENFTPPLTYLEGDAHDALAGFNSTHSSREQDIQTWVALFESVDEAANTPAIADLYSVLRAFRKRVSAYASEVRKCLRTKKSPRRKSHVREASPLNNPRL
jgi:hypothetical protein